ncbi:MAG: hypothetical protein ACR2JY_17765 [Chloroflexota bacterium]
MPTKPLGDPVSTHIVPTDGVPSSVRHALIVADAIHGVGAETVTIPLEMVDRLPHQAIYVNSDIPSELAILVIPHAPAPLLATTHEIGHFLDHQALGVPGQFASTSSELLAEWRSAVEATTGVATLRQELVKAIVGLPGAMKDPGLFSALLRLRDFLTYTLADGELFARSYAQFVFSQSDDLVARAALGRELARLRAQPLYLPTQWEPADFVPVAQAFARLLAKKGLME